MLACPEPQDNARQGGGRDSAAANASALRLEALPSEPAAGGSSDSDS